MKLNFKFLGVALMAMLCFITGCAPTSKAAQASPNMEKKTILIVGGSGTGTQSAIASLRAQNHPLVIVESTQHAPNDAIIQASIAPVISRIISLLPEVFINRKVPRQTADYVSRNGQNTVKPPENRLNRAKPNIVRLC